MCYVNDALQKTREGQQTLYEAIPFSIQYREWHMHITCLDSIASAVVVIDHTLYADDNTARISKSTPITSSMISASPAPSTTPSISTTASPTETSTATKPPKPSSRSS